MERRYYDSIKMTGVSKSETDVDCENNRKNSRQKLECKAHNSFVCSRVGSRRQSYVVVMI